MILFGNEVYDLDLRYARRLLHEEMEEAFNKNHEISMDSTEENIEDLAKAHKLISERDEEGLDNLFPSFTEKSLSKIREDDMLVNALKEANYQVEKSNVSNSVYAKNDQGQDVRISDHARPAYQPEGSTSYVEHIYKNEIIIKDNKVSKKELKKADFGRLVKEEYYLGRY